MSTKIAVVDTMIDLYCAQLNLSAIEINYSFYEERETRASYPKGHGTAVCGIIQKYVPDAHIILFPVSNCDDSSTLTKILNYIFEKKICKIINLSLGCLCTEKSRKELHVVCKKLYSAGILIVSAYDNHGLMSYPACFDEVIGVDTSENVKENDFIWIENSPINILCSSQKKRVLWESGNKVYVKGNSFSAPYISSIIAEIFLKTDDAKVVINLLKKRAICIQSISPDSLVNFKENMDNISKAIIFPVNDDTLPLMHFYNDCCFDIIGVYDFKYSSKIGKRVSNIASGTLDKDFVIQSYTEIDWQSDFDTVIFGTVNHYSNSVQNDMVKVIKDNCKKYRKSIFLLNNEISEYSSENTSLVINNLSSPSLAYPNALLGKKWVNSILKICFVSSGIDAESLYMQMHLKRSLLRSGRKVGHLATHKVGCLLGADATFLYNYKQKNSISEEDKSIILNNIIHEMEINSRDIIVSGLVAEVLPLNIFSPNPIVFLQGTFLYTLLPDVVILVVSIDDDIKLITRIIKMIQSMVGAKIVSILVSAKNIMFNNGLITSQNFLKTRELTTYINFLTKETGIATFELHEKNIDQIKEACLQYDI